MSHSNNDSGLNLDHLEAERARFEQAAPAFRINIERSKQFPEKYQYQHAQEMWDFWQLARRAAPVSAPIAVKTWQQRFEQAHPTSESAYWPDSLKVKYMDAEIADLRAALANQPAPTATQPELEVWYGAMPESNGKSNFTAILKRKGAGPFDTCHITIDRSEYPDRVRYEADRVRWLIGDLAEEPFILDYDANKHSGYVAASPVVRAQSEESEPMSPEEATALIARYEGIRQAHGHGEEGAVKPPRTAEEMVAFIGNHYNTMNDEKPSPDDIVYELTVHDLLSAMDWWFGDEE